jgi:peptide/nickel transport system permease protein
MGYLRRKILTYIAVIIFVFNFDFFLPRIAPGNAAELLAGGSFTEAKIALATARFGLNQPLYVQYETYVKNVLFTWPPNLGLSFQYYPTPVFGLFMNRVGWTLLLIVTSLILSIVISYVMAGISSLRRGGKAELGFLYSSILTQAMPIFWTGLVLVWVFSVDLHWLPDFGNGSNLHSGLGWYESVTLHAILPVVTMTVSILGQNYILLRGTAQEVLRSDYILAARTRGLRDRTIATAYILRNSLLPLVSILAFSFAGLVSRVVLVEAIFGYNGVGDLVTDAVVNHDYPVLEGTLLLVTLMIVLGGLIGDLLLVRLDPRLQAAATVSQVGR